MKKLMAVMAMVAMVAVSSVAFAADVVVNATVEGANIFTPCSGPLNLLASTNAATTNFQQSEIGDTITCNIILYANTGTQQDVTLMGTDNGLYNTVDTYSWTRLLTGANTIVAGTEAWGFQVANAGAYTVGTNDSGLFQNGGGAVVYTSGYHTVEEPTTGTADSIIDGAPTTVADSNFDLIINAATDDDTLAGSYTETITLTEVYA